MSSVTYKSYEDLPICLTVKNVASAMGISQVRAYELAKSEGFPKITIGKRIVIPKDAFISWLHKQML